MRHVQRALVFVVRRTGAVPLFPTVVVRKPVPVVAVVPVRFVLLVAEWFWLERFGTRCTLGGQRHARLEMAE